MSGLINRKPLRACAIWPFWGLFWGKPQCDSSKVTQEINFSPTGHFPWKSTWKGP